MPTYTPVEALKLNGGSLKAVANFINNTTPGSSGTYTPTDILSTPGDSMFDIMNYIDPSTHKLYSNIVPLTSTSPKAPENATKIWDLNTSTHMCFYVNQDDSNFYAISLNFYRADNSRILGRSITIWNQYEGLYYQHLYFFVYLSADNKYRWPYPNVEIQPNGTCRYSDFSLTTGDDLTDFISGNTGVIPHYVWNPVEQLAGNSGQFRLNLSQVKAPYIGDGLTQDATTDASKFIISDMSLLRTLTNNCAVGDEVTIGYCGRNYMTFTRDATDTRAGVLKFYYNGGLLAYTSPKFVVNPSTTQFKYLCFYKDTTEHVAMLQTITYSVSDPEYPSYSYNELYITYGATEPTEQDLIRMWVWLSDNGHTEEDINPYDTGTTDDGGDPGNPRPQDSIVDSSLPTLSGLESGIVTLYRPTAPQLTQISAFLWSNDVLDNFKKYFNNFADNILSLSIMPFTPSGLSTKLFKVGNMQSVDIGQVEYSTQRFFDINMGSVNINKLWGSYLDYSPYTKCEIYLPYLGLHSLDIDELMSPCKMDGSMPSTQGCTLSLTYRLDILTGVIVAKIAVTNEFITNQIRYQFSGKCGASIPLTGQTYAQLVQSMATIGAGLISTVATSGMAAPMIAGAAAVAATVQSQKPSVERIGNISGDASMLATNVPYIILSSPNKALLEKQEEFTGFPSYKSGTLQNFTGYCEVIDAHVEGITCTEEERAEILSLLKAGVII